MNSHCVILTYIYDRLKEFFLSNTIDNVIEYVFSVVVSDT